jgi:hypothetical protein
LLLALIVMDWLPVWDQMADVVCFTVLVIIRRDLDLQGNASIEADSIACLAGIGSPLT